MNTDPTINQLLDDTEQLVGNDEDADRNLVHGMLLETHTLLPGVLVSYNNDQQTAVCKPAIRRLVVDTGKMLTLPPCVDVPVFFPGGVLTFDISPGDSVVLAFSERCIDAWWHAGGVQDPVELRHHDLSDAFALIGFQPKPTVLQDVSQAGPELRTRDGSNRVSVRKDGTVHIGSAASASLLLPMVNGVVLASGIDTLTEVPFGLLGDSSVTVMAKP
jgi:hypothetical protein